MALCWFLRVFGQRRLKNNLPWALPFKARNVPQTFRAPICAVSGVS